MKTKPAIARITVLGGGPAGLGVGYFGRKAGLECLVLEAKNRAGGTSVTFRRGAFRYDSGAHRWHDRDASLTREVRGLLGADLVKVRAPSQIYFRGRFLDFPLSPLNALTKLGLKASSRAIRDFLRARLKPRPTAGDFESYAVHAYGKWLARAFLLNYSRKLWGLPCSELSPRVAGQRLKGLTLRSALAEALGGRARATDHLDGAFFYPRHGIGQIADALARACGPGRVRTRAAVTKLFHDGARVLAVQVNGRERLEVDEVASTLPLPQLLAALDPAPPARLLEQARRLSFRHVVLVTLFVDAPQVSRNASIYFPDDAYPFTRLYEPKNRSAALAPRQQTCLVFELPCREDDPCWTLNERALARQVALSVASTGLLEESAVRGSQVHRLESAYPVLDLTCEETVQALMAWLARFENLHTLGRCGSFAYLHLHDVLAQGRTLCAELAAKRA